MTSKRDNARPWQISLRTLLILVAMIGVGLGAAIMLSRCIPEEFEITLPVPS
jgi:hypothetical protein